MYIKSLKYYFLFFIIYVSTSCIHADTVSFSFENDAFVNEDSGYTSGIKIAWMDEGIETNASNSSYSGVIKNIVYAIPYLDVDESKKYNAGIALNQMIFTPEDLSIKRKQYQDIPYSGTLLLSFFLFEWDEESYHEFYIDTGVVGSSAYGEQSQKFIHRIFGARNPQGWDNQLGNQIMFDIAYGYGNRTWKIKYKNYFEADWVNAFRGQVGNFYTGASVNTMFRIGENYPKDFNLNIPGSLSNSNLLRVKRKNKGLGWSLSAGAQGDGISYLYVIDSANEYDIDRNKFSASIIGGASLYYKNVTVNFSVRRRTSLIKRNSASNSSFGSFTVVVHF